MSAQHLRTHVAAQCTEVDPGSGDQTTSLCEIPIPETKKIGDFINTAIAPMTYGYNGMQFVEIAS